VADYKSSDTMHCRGQWSGAGQLPAHHRRGERCRAAAPPSLQKRNFKNTDFADTIKIKVLRDLRFRLNQPLKSANDYYTGILKNITKT